MGKLVCDLSLDLDNKWSYMKTHGDDGWEMYPSYLSDVVPHILAALEQQRLRITFMVVGRDATRDCNQEALRRLAESGQELGNHSFEHEPWLQRYSAAQVHEELESAHVAISNIAEACPVGFRGPGFSLSADILSWLAKHDYVYDASTFPTFLGPAARAYYMLRSSFSSAERDEREQLFGRFRDGFRTMRPYRWQTEVGQLIEIPVSAQPFFRLPFHFTYLHYLGQFSSVLATAYLRWSLWLCRCTGFEPSLLMHPLDFLGGDEVQELSFFPGMMRGGNHKRQFMARALAHIATRFEVLSMQERVKRIHQQAQPLVTKSVTHL